MADVKTYKVKIEGDIKDLERAAKEADAITRKLENNEVEIDFKLGKSNDKVTAFLKELRKYGEKGEDLAVKINTDNLVEAESRLESIKKLREDIASEKITSGHEDDYRTLQRKNVKQRLKGYNLTLDDLISKNASKDTIIPVIKEALSYIKSVPSDLKETKGIQELVDKIMFRAQKGKRIDGQFGQYLGNFTPEDLLGINSSDFKKNRVEYTKRIGEATKIAIEDARANVLSAKEFGEEQKKIWDERKKVQEQQAKQAEKEAKENRDDALRRESEQMSNRRQKKDTKEDARDRGEREKAIQREKEEQELAKQQRKQAEERARKRREKLWGHEATSEEAEQPVEQATESVNKYNDALSNTPKPSTAPAEAAGKIADAYDEATQKVKDANDAMSEVQNPQTGTAEEIENVGKAAESAADLGKKKIEELNEELQALKKQSKAYDTLLSAQNGKINRKSLNNDAKYSVEDIAMGTTKTMTGKELKAMLGNNAKFLPRTATWDNGMEYKIKRIDGGRGKYDETLDRIEDMLSVKRERDAKIAEIESEIQRLESGTSAQQKVADAATEANNVINQMNDSGSDGSIEQQAEKNAEAINKEKEAVEELTAAKKEAEQTSSKAKSDEQVKTNEKIASSTEETTEAIKEQDEAYKTHQYHVSRQSLDKFGVATDKKGMESDRSMSYDEVMKMLKKGGYKYDPNTMRWRSPMKDDLLIEKNPKTKKTGNKKKDAMARWAETGLLTDQGYIEPERYHVMFEAQQKSAQEAAEAAEKEAQAEREKANATKESTKANEGAVESEKKKESAVESGTKKKDKDKKPPTKYDLRSYGIDSETGEARQIRSLGDLSRKEVDDFLGVAKWNDKHQMWVAPNGKYAYESFDSEGKRRVPNEKGKVTYRASEVAETAEERATEILKDAVNNTAEKVNKNPQAGKQDTKKIQSQTQKATEKTAENIVKNAEEEIETLESGQRRRKRAAARRGPKTWEYETEDGKWETLEDVAKRYGLKKESLYARMHKTDEDHEHGYTLLEALKQNSKRGRKSGQIASTEGSGASSVKEAVKSKGKNVRRVDESLSAEDLIAREQALEAAEESIKRQAKAAGEVITGVTNFYDSAENLVKQEVKTRGLDVDDAMNAVIQNKTYTSEYGVDTGEAFTSHVDRKTKADPKQIDMLRELGDVLTSDQALFDRFGESYREFYDKVLGGDMSGASKLGKDLKSQIETYQGIEKQSEAIKQFGEELQKDDGIFREFGDQYKSLVDQVSSASTAKELENVTDAFTNLKNQVSDKKLEIGDKFDSSFDMFYKIEEELNKDSDLMREFGTEYKTLMSDFSFSPDNMDSSGIEKTFDNLKELMSKIDDFKADKAFDVDRMVPQNALANLRKDLKEAGISFDDFSKRLKDAFGYDLTDIGKAIGDATKETGLGDVNTMISNAKKEATRAISEVKQAQRDVDRANKEADAAAKLENAETSLANGKTIAENNLNNIIKDLEKAGISVDEFNSKLKELIGFDFKDLREGIKSATVDSGLGDINKLISAAKAESTRAIKEAASKEREISKQDIVDDKLETSIAGSMSNLVQYFERAKALGSSADEIRASIVAMYDAFSSGKINTNNLSAAQNIIKELNADLNALESKQKSDTNKYSNAIQNGFNFLNTRDQTKYTQEMYTKINDLKQAAVNLDLGKNLDLGDDKVRGDVESFIAALEELKMELKSLDNQVAKDSSIKKLDVQLANFASKNKKLTSEMVADIERWREALKEPGLTKGSYNNIFSEFKELESSAIDQGLVGQVGMLENLGNRIKQMNTNFIGMYFSFYDIVRYAKEIGQSVTEINSAQTELRKVSDASQTRIQENFKTSAETAQEMGATISDVINSTSDWARLGYSVDEAEVLARNTALYQTVGDNMTQESASEYMTSIMKGYQYDADQSESIIDKVNEVANNYSIDTQGKYNYALVA